jgi:hypothetical protein
MASEPESKCLHTPSSASSEQLSPGQEQIREGCKYIDAAAVLSKATQPVFLESELLFDHPEWMCDHGADACLCSLDPPVSGKSSPV